MGGYRGFKVLFRNMRHPIARILLSLEFTLSIRMPVEFFFQFEISLYF